MRKGGKKKPPQSLVGLPSLSSSPPPHMFSGYPGGGINHGWPVASSSAIWHAMGYATETGLTFKVDKQLPLINECILSILRSNLINKSSNNY